MRALARWPLAPTTARRGARWPRSYDSTAGGNHGVGQLSNVTDQSGGDSHRYDAEGRVIQTTRLTQNRAYATAYTRDANGELVQMVYPSGRLVTIARTTDGQVTGVTTAASGGSTETVASGVTYRPFGPLSGLTHGNGLVLTRAHDGNDWLAGITVAGGGVTRLNLTFARDGTGALTGVADALGGARTASFGYSDAGRLTSATGSWGADLYGWDAAGNRIGMQRTIGSAALIADQVIAAGSNRIASTGTPGGARTFTHRAGGDVASSTLAGVSTTYGYNARHRLASVSEGGVQTGAYGYDAWGRRVWRQRFGAQAGTVHQVFDLEGRLVAEHDGGSGYPLREFVWLDDLLIAVVDSTGATPVTYAVHAGQLDEPVMLTDATGAVVWQAYQEPFGAAVTAGSPPLELRLPGQWLQPETGGLHQNWNRDYDPSTGRFIQADPLGLEAGQNLYAYVDGDPLNGIDPTGLVDMNLVPQDETSLVTSANHPVTDPIGYFTIAAHGDPTQVWRRDRRPISMMRLAQLIRRHPRYQRGQPIILGACRTGQGDLPQQLADILGVPVFAPVGYGWWRRGTRQWSADRVNGRPGSPRPWREFRPRQSHRDHSDIPSRLLRGPW